MNTLRVVLVDDEPLARMRMRALLSQAGTAVEVIGEFGDAVSALQAFKVWDEQGGGADVLFLDIAMPGPDGMQLAQRLLGLKQPPLIVFVTAHPEHAVSAFELDAADYLTKPVRLERLEATLARVVSRRATEQTPLQKGVLLDEVLVVHDRGTLVRLPLRDIVYFKAEQKYVTVRTADQAWVIDESLSELEARLGSRFIRVHRNALVAREAMSKLERREDPATAQEAWALQMEPTKEWLAVSRRQIGLVKETMASCK